jgi:pimeloyl-ACP methyl ester carboxylesterase
MPTLAKDHDVVAVDLPGHGASPPSSFTPPDWADEVADLLDRQGLGRVAMLGHSAGGWTALELAKEGRATTVLALTPAGLWRKRSPFMTDLALNANWRLGRLSRRVALRALKSPTTRSLALRNVSARPKEVTADVAIPNARAALATDSFPRHFAETRRLRFLGGRSIDVPVKVIWGDKDRIALPGRSRFLDELPSQTQVETWTNCGHMLMWDAPDKVIAAIQSAASLPHHRESQRRRSP